MQLADLFALVAGRPGRRGGDRARAWTAGRRRSGSASFMRAATGWRMPLPDAVCRARSGGLPLEPRRIRRSCCSRASSSDSCSCRSISCIGSARLPYSRDAQPRIVVTTRAAFPGIRQAANPVDATELTGKRRPSPAGDVRVLSTVTRRRRSSTHRARRALQGRGAVAQQPPRNTVNLVACWRITASDRYLAVLPLFPRPRSRERAHDLAGQRLPDAAGRALRRGARRGLVPDLSADAFFRCADHLRAAARASPGARIRDRHQDAAVRQRLGAASAGRLRRVPRASGMSSSSATG